MSQRERGTWTLAEGEGWLKLSEREAIAQMRARMVTAKVSKAFALYPNECIFSSFCLTFSNFLLFASLAISLLLLFRFFCFSWFWVRSERERSRRSMGPGPIFCMQALLIYLFFSSCSNATHCGRVWPVKRTNGFFDFLFVGKD